MPETRFDDFITRDASGSLRIEACPVRNLAEKFGTPLYVISEGQIRQNAQRYQQEFSKRWTEGSVHILAAIKANHNLALRTILTQEGCGCDVFSEGELWAALTTGVPPEMISLNGNGKLGQSDEMLRIAIERGVKITIDHAEEYPLIESIARQLGKKAIIRFRLRPEFRALSAPTDFSSEKISIEFGTQAYKSGIPTEDLLPLGIKALSSECVDVRGLHIHVGRHAHTPEFWSEIILGYTKLMAELRAVWNGWEPTEIDIGGGFPCLRDPMARQIDRSSHLFLGLLWILTRLARRMGNFRYRIDNLFLSMSRSSMINRTGADPTLDLRPDLAIYADKITQTLRNGLKRYGFRTEGKILELEPGRGIYENTCTHLTRVTFIKSQSKPVRWKWANVDTSDSFIKGVSEMHSLFRYVVADKPIRLENKEDWMVADIVGRSCNFDRIVPDAILPVSLHPGDIIAFLDTGAYQEPSACNFNALPRPATVLVHGAEVDLIRRSETMEDVFGRDLIPERLKWRE